MAPPPRRLRLDGCSVDLDRQVAEWPDRTEHLTATETRLLAYLAAQDGRDVPREELLEHVWGYRPTVASRAPDTAVRRLRAKIELDRRNPAHLHATSGGYRFTGPSELVPNAARSHNVVRPVTPMAGRSQDLEALIEAVDAGRLVTVLGPGGIGKTRLLVELGLVLQRAGRAVWLCDLTSAEGVEDLCRAVVRAFGVPLDADRPRAQVAALLGEGEPVLLLDNFEQVVACADVVAGWLGATGARVVVTSRVALGLPGERRHALGPLAPDAGLQLLTDRAREVRPEFQPDADAAALVARLDGVPLAIELAASRITVLSLRGLLHRLEEDPVGTLARRGDGRHASLDAALASSWDLLDADERSVVRQCAVFRGDFDLAGASAVVRANGSLLDVLQALVDASWLRTAVVGDTVRFAMLLPVRDWLSGDLDDATRDRHAAWYARFGSELYGLWDPAGTAGRRQRAVERANLLAAFTWARRQGRVEEAVDAWLALLASPGGATRATVELAADLGAGGDARARIEAARADNESVPTQRRAQWERAIANLTRDDPRLAAWILAQAANDGTPEGEAWLDEATELARGLDPATRLHVELCRASRLGSLGEVHTATDLLQRAMPELDAMGDDRLTSRAAEALGVCLFLAGRAAEAAEALDRALALDAEVGEPLARVELLRTRAVASEALGEPARARELLDEGLALARRLGSPAGEAWARMTIAAGAEVDEAERHAQLARARALFEGVGYPLGVSYVDCYLGAMASRAGDLADAERLLRAGLARVREEPVGGVSFAVRLAEVLIARGARTEATEWLDWAEPRTAEPGLLAEVWAARAALGPDRAAALARARAYGETAGKSADWYRVLERIEAAE